MERSDCAGLHADALHKTLCEEFFAEAEKPLTRQFERMRKGVSIDMRCVALVGGMDRLEQHYKTEAARVGVALKVFSALEGKTVSRIKGADAVVIFTNKISHNLKREAVKAARSSRIPVFYCHACGICTLRACLKCLANDGGDNLALRDGCCSPFISRN